MGSGTVDAELERGHSEFLREWLRAQPAVAGYVMVQVRDPSTCDDIVQEVAMAAFRSFDRYDGSRPFVAWALGIARHKTIDHMRGARVAWTLLDDEARAEIERAAGHHAETLSDQALAMHACMEELRGRSRELIRRYYADGQAVRAIAQAMQLGRSNVKVLLHRIRASLRRCVERRLAG